MPEAASAPAPAGPLVHLDGVSVSLGGRNVLSGIGLEIRPGEVTTLIGPNGAGKTTLARVVLGLQRVSAGQVHRRPGLSVGYMPQRIVVDPVLPLSVGRMVTLTRRAGRSRVLEVLGQVGCRHLADQPVQTLSGGEMQRVMLARALLGRPDLLVLDEPAQNVDVVGQAELYDLIARLRGSQGCGVLMISHDLHVVMAATDRVVCVNGHVCCSGTPEAVSRDPVYLGLFGVAAAGSFALYRHAHGHRHEADGCVVPLGQSCGHGRTREAGGPPPRAAAGTGSGA